MRSPTIFAAALLGGLAFSVTAYAEAPVCGDLRAQLSALGPARAAPQVDGCAGLGLLQRVFSGCGRILRMSSGDSLGTARHRAELQQAMARWGCSSGSATNAANSGTVRTLCVRICDGYYFPISTAATRKRIKIDAGVCAGMYPGGGAELYTQRLSSDPDADMRSLSGQSYDDQPFAYRYRDVYDASCAGQLNRTPGTATGAPAEAAAAPPNDIPTAAVDASFTPLPAAVRVVGPEAYFTNIEPIASQSGKPVRKISAPAALTTVAAVP